MPRARSRRSSSASFVSDRSWSSISRGTRRVAFDERVGQPELHGQGHELLLRAVVDVAFEPATFIVLRRHQSLLGRLQIVDPRAELLGEPHVAEHQPGLCREVGDQSLLRRIHGVVRGHRHREGPEELTLVPHLDRQIGVAGGGGYSWRCLGVASGHDATALKSSSTRSNTSARSAPTPSPSTRAILGSTSSAA